MITGRGDKTVKPRSFTPDSLDVLNFGVSSTPSVSHNNEPTQSTLKVGNVVIVNEHNKEEISFQPKPYKPENYRVTDFSHQTTPQGHSYR